MLNHYDFQIKAMNTAIRMTLRSQCVQPESSFYGAVEWLDKGYTGAHSAVCVAREMIEGYYTPQCAYAGDELLLERARIAIDYALRQQHEDGTFDLLETNFHDSAETSFIMQNIGPPVC